MTRQVTSDWRAEVLQADPEWHTKYNIIEEYKFSNGRVFEGRYAVRGAYGPDYD